MPLATTGPSKQGGGLWDQEPAEEGGGVQGQSQFGSRGTDGMGRAAGRKSMAADLHQGPRAPLGHSFCLPELAAPHRTVRLHPAPGHAAGALRGHMLGAWACSSASGRSLQGQVPRGLSAPSSPGAPHASTKPPTPPPGWARALPGGPQSWDTWPRLCSRGRQARVPAGSRAQGVQPVLPQVR